MIDKALSLTQPWAWLVAMGIKPIENRSWNTHFRGRFFIHSTQSMPLKEYYRCQAFCLQMGFLRLPTPDWCGFLLGSILGSVELYDVLPKGVEHPWKFKDKYGYMLRNAEWHPPVQCKGALNFWNVKYQQQLRDKI